uniref:Transmembrane protein 222a n=1 Tax=Cyclopterus lumpus TaxID=8103 RepID=A0A8C2Z4M6_CYCLU
ASAPPGAGSADNKNSRYPYCIVWTPIPILSWVLPFIGHMGICTSSGIIRDFAGSYFVSDACRCGQKQPAFEPPTNV